jgi:hypothetical protein
VDTVSPEFPFNPDTARFTGGQWLIDDNHALMFHQPTSTVLTQP